MSPDYYKENKDGLPGIYSLCSRLYFGRGLDTILQLYREHLHSRHPSVPLGDPCSIVVSLPASRLLGTRFELRFGLEPRSQVCWGLWNAEVTTDFTSWRVCCFLADLVFLRSKFKQINLLCCAVQPFFKVMNTLYRWSNKNT